MSSSEKWSVVVPTWLPSSHHWKPVCAEMRGWKESGQQGKDEIIKNDNERLLWPLSRLLEILSSLWWCWISSKRPVYLFDWCPELASKNCLLPCMSELYHKPSYCLVWLRRDVLKIFDAVETGLLRKSLFRMIKLVLPGTYIAKVCMKEDFFLSSQFECANTY